MKRNGDGIKIKRLSRERVCVLSFALTVRVCRLMKLVRAVLNAWPVQSQDVTITSKMKTFALCMHSLCISSHRIL